MTWVPHYAVGKGKARLAELLDGVGMKDALTHLGLQFWVPTGDGGITRIGRPAETTDDQIEELREWGHANGVRVLLCIYNGGKTWDWPLARAGFATHTEKFIEALLTEVNRLNLDGVDVDLEGIGSFDADKEAFVSFIRALSVRLHADGKHLTVDTFSYKWNAPNQTWWPELLPLVDGLTSMGYEQLGSQELDWRGYAFQKSAAGRYASKLMIGLPSHVGKWRDGSAMEHLQWLRDNGETGVSFWDAQISDEAWRTAEVWRTLEMIRGK